MSWKNRWNTIWTRLILSHNLLTKCNNPTLQYCRLSYLILPGPRCHYKVVSSFGFHWSADYFVEYIQDQPPSCYCRPPMRNALRTLNNNKEDWIVLHKNGMTCSDTIETRIRLPEILILLSKLVRTFITPHTRPHPHIHTNNFLWN